MAFPHSKSRRVLPPKRREVPCGICYGEGFSSQRAAEALLDQTIIESMVPDLSVLRTAFLIERDSAGFYEGAAKQAEDETVRRALHMLAEWERGHERLFE